VSAWEEAKREILSRLNFKLFYDSHGVIKWASNATKGNVSAFCPMHDDKKTASLSINIDDGTYKCFSPDCNASHGGSVFDWIMLQDGCDFRTAFEILAKDTGVALPDVKPEIPSSLAEEFHKRMLPRDIQWFLERRGLHKDTLRRFKVGRERDRYMIPITDEHGKIRNIRRYKPNPSGQQAKFLHFIKDGVKYGSPARIYGLTELVDSRGEDVIICEGELDRLVLVQNGFMAVTSTGGAGTFLPDWCRWFEGRLVTLVFDNDGAGQAASEKVAEMLGNAGVDVQIAELPEAVGPKGDVTDFFVALGGTAQDFKENVLARATLWEPKEISRVDEEAPLEVTLPRSSDAKLFGRPLKVKVMVSGKDTTPYVVPKVVRLRCPADGRKLCEHCGLSSLGGKVDHEFTARDRELIAFTACSDTQLKGEILAKFKVATRCPAWRIEVDEQHNLEEIRLIPEIDYFHQSQSVEEEYVVRNAIYIGQGLQANRSYDLISYSQSDPRTQYAMLVVDEAIPAQDSIASFTMTEELAEQLGVFKVAEESVEGVRDRFEAIALDMESNVHHIYQRHEMQTAFDLIWHSVIGFDFDEKQIRKGWVEGLVMGDSGQGKTEMSLCLLQHYGMGERVQGEQVSIAGLVGGVEQTQKRWMLTWGKMPLNDRRMLIVEEAGGMPVDDLAKLSDVRSTGVAEITKMRTERTNARCRLAFLSNPRSGRPIRTYDHGVSTALELFGKAEDVRRLDFMVVVATGEVPVEVLNRLRAGGPQVPHVYERRLCKKLILWAWSRNPRAVKFSDEACASIVTAAREMSAVYSPKIPLAEPADLKIKLARMSAAAAARVFSTPEGDPGTVLVGPQHVGFVVRFLNEQYCKPTMAYREYSDIADAGERLDRMELGDFVARFKEIPEWHNVVRVWSRNRILRKTELIDMVGWSREDSRTWFRVMTTELGCIKSTPNGFVKQPFFIPILREMLDEVRATAGVGEDNGQMEEPF
jgi:hypothetical protein